MYPNSLVGHEGLRCGARTTRATWQGLGVSRVMPDGAQGVVRCQRPNHSSLNPDPVLALWNWNDFFKSTAKM